MVKAALLTPVGTMRFPGKAGSALVRRPWNLGTELAPDVEQHDESNEDKAHNKHRSGAAVGKQIHT